MQSVTAPLVQAIIFEPSNGLKAYQRGGFAWSQIGDLGIPIGEAVSKAITKN